MNNLLLDNNVIIDILSERRREKYPQSLEIYNLFKEYKNLFISSSSLDNIEFILFKEIQVQFDYPNKKSLEEAHKRIKKITKDIKIAKTPSYVEIDYDDIEDSQIIASAKAISAKVLTRDQKMLEKYPDMTITPKEFLDKGEVRRMKAEGIASDDHPSTFKIDFANLKKQYFLYQSEIEEEMDKVLNSAGYIMGDAVKTLERNLEKFTGAKHAITCSSGTDALLLAMMALDIQPGDEIITTPFTCTPSLFRILIEYCAQADVLFLSIWGKTKGLPPRVWVYFSATSCLFLRSWG